MFWQSVFDLFDFSGDALSDSSAPDITFVNPATGLPMMDNSTCGVDVGGNPYGTDTHQISMDSFDITSFNPYD